MKNKTHILFGLPSLSVGGIEKQLIKQLELFDRNRFKISLITLFEYSDTPNLYDDVPLDIDVYKLSFKNKLDLRNFKELRRILRITKPDVVITSMFSANTLFRILKNKKEFNYICIPREHNIYHEKKRWQRYVDKILANKSYKIISVSKSVADFAAKQSDIPIDRFEVIHNGVEVDKIDAFLAENNILKENIFLNVGRLKKQKNQKLLIEAFAKVSDRLKDWKLVIVGRGSEEENLKDFIKALHLEERVILAGYSDNVYEYYAKAKAFILTSKYEGFPNVAVEAMAFSLPLVSTSVPGVDEFLKNNKNGFLVEESLGSVSNAMLKVANLSNDDYKQLSLEAKKTARKFDIKENVGKYEKLVIKVLSAREVIEGVLKK